jgi:hypothetical protein
MSATTLSIQHENSSNFLGFNPLFFLTAIIVGSYWYLVLYLVRESSRGGGL